MGQVSAAGGVCEGQWSGPPRCCPQTPCLGSLHWKKRKETHRKGDGLAQTSVTAHACGLLQPALRWGQKLPAPRDPLRAAVPAAPRGPLPVLPPSESCWPRAVTPVPHTACLPRVLWLQVLSTQLCWRFRPRHAGARGPLPTVPPSVPRADVLLRPRAHGDFASRS